MAEPIQETNLPQEIIPLNPAEVAKEITNRDSQENSTAEIIVGGTTKEQLTAVIQQLKEIGANHLAQIAENFITAGAKELANKVPGLGEGFGKTVKDAVIDKAADHLLTNPPERSNWVKKVNGAVDKLSAVAGPFVPGAELVGAVVKAQVTIIDTNIKQVGAVGEAVSIVNKSPEMQVVKDRVSEMKTNASNAAADLFKKLPFKKNN